MCCRVASRLILCSLVVLALVLPAAPASAQSTPPDCDKTWTPDPATSDYSANTAANWSPAGTPVASDIVCLPADAAGYGPWVGSGTITAAELHILSASATIYYEVNLQVPVIHAESSPHGYVELHGTSLTGVNTLASGRYYIAVVEQLGSAAYGNVTSTFEVLEAATLVVTQGGHNYDPATRPLTVHGELQFLNSFRLYSWHAFAAPVSIPGTLRLSNWEPWQDNNGDGCGGSGYGTTLWSNSTTHITGSVIVEDGQLDLSYANLTVGPASLPAVTVEGSDAVLNGPAGGYLVSNHAALALTSGTQIQKLQADLTLEGTGTLGRITSDTTTDSHLASLDTVTPGASLTLRDSIDLCMTPGMGYEVRDSAVVTTTAPLTNHGSVTVGRSSTLTAASYTQDGTAENPASTTLGANASLNAAGGTTLTDGAFSSTSLPNPATVTTPTLVNNGAALTLGSSTGTPGGLRVAGAYTQAGPEASTNLMFGAAKGNPKLTTTGQVELNSGSVKLSVPEGRTFIPGSLTLIAGSAFTRAAGVTTSGVPADTTDHLYTLQVNEALTELRFVTDDVHFDGEEDRDVSAMTAYDGHYYELVPTTGTWDAAKAQAANSSYLASAGHLVTIASADENSFVNGLDTSGGAGYLGFSDQVIEGQFKWVSGEAVSYTAWSPGEPNNQGDEDCTHMYSNGVWNDSLCSISAASHFVIEYDGPFYVDTDGDGVADKDDAFPDDARETTDSDSDGVGNNADAFPDDPDETTDTDGDGVGDNTDADDTDGPLGDSDGDGSLNKDDAFDDDPNETADSDSDGVGDNADAFPNDANETADADGDGTGDNADADDTDGPLGDSDGDGSLNKDDAFPNDASEAVDSDGDGVGDNADPFPFGTHTLTLGGDGTGSGVVTSSPAGIDCGSDCSQDYGHVTQVTLTAAAAASSTFAGWAGACTDATGTCTVTMDQARAVTATFTADSSGGGGGGGGDVATPTSATTGGAATESDPAHGTVTSPDGGVVTIVAEPVDHVAGDRFVSLDAQFEVSAPDAAAARPLVLVFRLHESLFPDGDDQTTVQVLRNSVQIGSCPGSTTADSGPCVSGRERDDEQIVLTVLTSRASEWSFVVPARAEQGPCDDVPDAGFSDVSTANVHRPAIDCAAFHRIAKGLTDSTYGPGRAVTRAQMATFVANTVREAGAALPEGRNAFIDDIGNIHEVNINALAEAGIVAGTSPGRYGPDERVSREQMATFLVAAYDYTTGTPLPAGPDAFGDDDSSVHQPNINKAGAAGFTTGVDSDTYAPTSPVKRDQMASFLTRMFTAAHTAR